MRKKPDSRMQKFLLVTLAALQQMGRFRVWLEQRLQTRRNPARFRVPDICVTFGEPDEDVFTVPPFLCIEILSPEDSVAELRGKIEEYLEMGVTSVWVIDSVQFTGEIYTEDRIDRVRDGLFRAGEIEVDIWLAKS